MGKKYNPMGDPLLVEAYLNRPDWKLLGEPVHPLCLADVLNFAITGNPLLEGAELTKDRLVNAVLILSHPVSPFGGFWVDPVKRDRLIKRLAETDLETEAFVFNKYVRDYWDPVHAAFLLETEVIDAESEAAFQVKQETKPKNIPWVLNYVVALSLNTNLTEEQIWSMPIGQVFYRHAATEAYKHAHCRLRSPDEREKAVVDTIDSQKNSFEALYRQAYERAEAAAQAAQAAKEKHGKA